MTLTATKSTELSDSGEQCVVLVRGSGCLLPNINISQSSTFSASLSADKDVIKMRGEDSYTDVSGIEVQLDVRQSHNQRSVGS